ncbi:MAG: hypothetical protein H0X40_09135 [Chthoniobacterales bacterium]|nr:hypothetical protein [Chthoniobacterales bacterium]
MARILLRTSLIIVSLIALALGWIAGARRLSLFLDGFHTAEIESRPVTKFGAENVSGGMLRIDEVEFSTAGPDYRPGPIRMQVNQNHQLVCESDSRTIVLGEGADSLGTIRPAQGVKARLQISRSLVSWPTPLAINFMTGVSPSWKRHLYYRLIWERRDGGRLELVWRYEQWFYQSWASGFMTHPGTTGLVRAELRP